MTPTALPRAAVAPLFATALGLAVLGTPLGPASAAPSGPPAVAVGVAVAEDTASDAEPSDAETSDAEPSEGEPSQRERSDGGGRRR